MKVLRAGIDPDLHLTNTGENRPGGVHLSDIIKRRMFERDKKFNPKNPIDAMVLERGFTWEYVLERALAARDKRPGYRPDPLQEDGIWLSPDWVNPDAADIQHEEWKATKKSTKHDFADKNWFWLPQAMAYLRSLVRRGLAHALATRFRVWHINGDYSYESKNSDFHLLNDYWTYDIEWSQRELDENWRGILGDARRYGLLKTAPIEESWPKTRKSVSNPPRKSPKAAKVLTFQNSRTPQRNSRNES